MADDFDFSGVNVLVVEDEAHTRRIIKAMLRNIGIQMIAEAENGRDGLIEAQSVRPHVVLCDVHMQPIDGREFLKTLRELPDEKLRETPVIFLTADAKRDTVIFAKDHLVNGYIVKPTSPGTLKSRIEAVLKNPKATL
jgi:two-component system, chemotaxis family, chemotaxis protein CheY